MTTLSDKTVQAFNESNAGKIVEARPEWLTPPVLEIGKMQGFRNRWGMRWTATKPDGTVVFVREIHDLEKMRNAPKTEQQCRMMLVEPIKELLARLETYLDPKCLCTHDNPVLCPVDHTRR